MMETAQNAPSPRRTQTSPLIVIAALIVILYGLAEGQEFLVPLCLSALLGFLMAPVMRGLRRAKLPEWACIALSAAVLVLPLLGCLYLAATEIQGLVTDWPKISQTLQRTLGQLRESSIAAKFHVARFLDPAEITTRVQDQAGSGIKLALASLQKLLTAGSMLLLVIFFAVVMLASRRHLQRSAVWILESYTSISSRETVGRMAQMIETFLLARMAITVLVAVASAGVLLAFGIPYSFVLGAIMGLMTWVPIVGFVLGIAPVLAVGFGVGKGEGAMLGSFLILGTLWMIQDHILTPKWVGHKLKLNFLATYVAFFAGERLWGAWGMFLSVPMLGVLRIAMSASPRLQPWAFALSEVGDPEEAAKDSEIPTPPPAVTDAGKGSAGRAA